MANNIDQLMNHRENPNPGFPFQPKAVLMTSSGNALKDGA